MHGTTVKKMWKKKKRKEKRKKRTDLIIKGVDFHVACFLYLWALKK